ncbi:MAG: hypothetical protein ACYCSN_16625 [Acidobacteriaceae bacterium]
MSTKSFASSITKKNFNALLAARKNGCNSVIFLAPKGGFSRDDGEIDDPDLHRIFLNISKDCAASKIVFDDVVRQVEQAIEAHDSGKW